MCVGGLGLLFEENADDTFGAASVPSVGDGGIFPAVLHELGDSLSQPLGIFADEEVGARFDGFDVFGIAIECDAGHAVEGGFFGHVARVGDDAFGVCREVAELEIGERWNEVEGGSGVGVELLETFADDLGGFLAQRGDDRVWPGLADEFLEHVLQQGAPGDEGFAIEGEDEIGSVFCAQCFELTGTDESVAVVPECIHEDVAHEIDFGGFGSFSRGDAIATRSGGEEEVAESVDDEPVDFLGHVDVEAACSGHEVCQEESLFFGDDGGGECRGEVVYDDDDRGGMGLEMGLEGGHHLPGEFVEVGAVYAQAGRGAWYLQVGKEGWLQRGIVCSTGIHQLIVYSPALLSGLVDGVHNGCYFDKIGAGARYDTYVHFVGGLRGEGVKGSKGVKGS